MKDLERGLKGTKMEDNHYTAADWARDALEGLVLVAFVLAIGIAGMIWGLA
jgi:hypothetical protein